MHPLIARIPPSLRTGFLAWLVSRSFIWGLVFVRKGSEVAGFLEVHSGPPLWIALSEMVRRAGFSFDPNLLLLALVELSLLGASVYLYKVTRKQQLPQVAERVVWLWAFSPVMILLLPISSTAPAALFVMVSVYALAEGRAVVGVISLALAIGFRPELIILVPGISIFGCDRQKDLGAQTRAFIILGPLLAFVATIGAAVLFAGDFGISLRTLDPATAWRTFSMEWFWDLRAGADLGEWIDFAASALEEIVFIGFFVGGGYLLLRHRKHLPRGLVWTVVPTLGWPILFDAPLQSSYFLILSPALFIVLGRQIQSRSIERLALLAMSVGLVWVGCIQFW